MYIPDKKWDEFNAECIKVIEDIEAIPENLLMPFKEQILAILYDIVHMQDLPLPKQEPSVKQILRDVRKLLSLK